MKLQHDEEAFTDFNNILKHFRMDFNLAKQELSKNSFYELEEETLQVLKALSDNTTTYSKTPFNKEPTASLIQSRGFFATNVTATVYSSPVEKAGYRF